MFSESLNICKSSDDPAKTPHLQLSWQTRMSCTKQICPTLRPLTVANKRVSAYTRNDQDCIKKNVENVKSTDYEAKDRARDLPQPPIFHLKGLSLHALRWTGRCQFALIWLDLQILSTHVHMMGRMSVQRDKWQWHQSPFNKQGGISIRKHWHTS